MAVPGAALGQYIRCDNKSENQCQDKQLATELGQT